MIRHTAAAVVMSLVVSSGGLLLCQWACATDPASPDAAACHTKQDDAAVMQTGTAHDCIATTTAQATTAAKSVERTKPPVATSPVRTVVSFAMLPHPVPHSPAQPGTDHLARSLAVVVLRI